MLGSVLRRVLRIESSIGASARRPVRLGVDQRMTYDEARILSWAEGRAGSFDVERVASVLSMPAKRARQLVDRLVARGELRRVGLGALMLGKRVPTYVDEPARVAPKVLPVWVDSDGVVH